MTAGVKRTLMFSAAMGLSLMACGRIGYDPRVNPDVRDAAVDAETADAAADASEAGLGNDDGASASDADAPSDDAGFPDTPPATGPRIESCPERAGTAWFCDDFEQGVPGAGEAGPYTDLSNDNGTVSTDPNHAHNGSKSAHLRVRRRGNQASEARLAWSLPMEAWNEPALYLRSWFFLQPGLPVSNYVVLQEFGGPTGKASADLGDMDEISVHPLTVGGGTFPRDRWACLEFQLERPPPGGDLGRIRLLLDEQVLFDQAVASRWVPLDTYRRIAFGLFASGLREDLNAWMDDVVLSRTPIGCD